MKTTDLPGARESNAGDEFHLLWSIQQLLRTLDPSSGLRRVVLEGLSPVDAALLEPDELLGADATCYFGGDDVPRSSRVEIAQLKYSQRNPGTKWTVARLCSPGSRGGASVVKRLADLFSGVARAHPSDLAKVTVKLISNQPAAADLTRTLSALKKSIASDRVRHWSSLAVDGTPEAAAVTRLKEATGLSLKLFSAFVAALDLSELGALDRKSFTATILRQLATHVGDPSSAYQSLYHLVSQQVLPEAAKSRGLVFDDVLAHLGVGDRSALFPAPNRYAAPEVYFESADVRTLADAIVSGSSSHIIATGPAGVGKSSTLDQLQASLPLGSVVTIFDCFGRGDYLNPAEPRHTPQSAILQLTNEIALEGGLPLLVKVQNDTHVWKTFSSRLEELANLIPDGSVLVVAVDAADNAVVAESLLNGGGFVSGLWEIPLPPRVWVVMTARTHRLDSVYPPARFERVELNGYTLSGSEANLKVRFPAASPEAVATFHENSQGNPRVQFYALDAKRTTTLDEALDQARRTPNDLFEDLTMDALSAAGPDGRQHLAILAALPRPAMVSALAGSSGIEVSAAHQLAQSLVPGVILSEGGVEFRDEDFETFVRDLFDQEEMKAAHASLADYFLSLRNSDPVAAELCAQELRLAGRDRELIQLALEDETPAAIIDPLRATQVRVDRLRLALASVQLTDAREQVEILVNVAKASRASKGSAETIRTRPQLATKYADPVAVSRTFGVEEANEWRLSWHLQSAGTLAAQGNESASASQLRRAEAWIRRRHDEDARWPLAPRELAAGVDAIWHLEGLKSALKYLFSWGPLDFCLKTLEALMIRRLPLDDGSVVSAMLDGIAGPWSKLWCLSIASRLGFVVDPMDLAVSASDTTRRDIPAELQGQYPSWDETSGWRIDFAEALSRTPSNRELARIWLQRHWPDIPNLPPSNWEGLGKWREPLRAETLLAQLDRRPFKASSLLDRIATPHANQRWTELESAIRIYEPAYTLRARVVIENPTRSEIDAAATAALAGLRSERSETERPNTDRLLVLASCVADARGSSRKQLDAIAEKALAGRFSASALLQLAEVLNRRASTRAVAAQWLDRSANLVRKATWPAHDKVEVLLDLADEADRFDHAAGASYYQFAVEAAQGLDDDGADVLNVINALAVTAARDPQLDSAVLASRVVAALEDWRPYVSDEGYLPWGSSIEAAAALDLPFALGAACRWEHNGSFVLKSSLPHLAEVAHSRMLISAERAIALLELAGRQDFSLSVALEICDRTADSTGQVDILNRILEIVRRDYLPDSRLWAARQLQEWARDKEWAQPLLLPLRNLIGYRTLKDEQPFTTRYPSDQNWARKQRNRRARRSKLLQSAEDGRIDLLVSRVRRLQEVREGSHDIAQLLRRYGDAIPPSERTALLDVVADDSLAESIWQWGADEVTTLLSRWHDEWSSYLPVDRWFSDKGVDLVADRLSELARGGGNQGWLRLYAGLSKGDLHPLLQSLASKLDLLDTRHLFALAADLCGLLDASDSAALLVKLAPAAPPEIAGPLEPVEALRQTVWSILGHRDKRIRWDAAHVALRLLDEDPDFTGWLLEQVATRPRPNHGYYPAEAFFPAVSAAQWAMFSIARHDPGALDASHADLLTEILEDASFPHAAIRELAARTLSGFDPQRGSAAEMTVRPASCWIHRPKKDPRDLDVNVRIAFHFNSLDTLPYWYEPFGRIFGMSRDRIAQLADGWMTTLGYSPTAELPEDTNGSRFDWSDAQNDHGAQPRVDDFPTYLEYHALQLVAGRLVDEKVPLHVEYHGDSDPWDRWIGEHIPSNTKEWLSDWRAEAPDELRTYVPFPPGDTFNPRAELIGHTSSALTVAGYEYYSDSHSYAWTSITSALVSPSSARSLGRLLIGTDARSFQLPDWPGDEELEESQAHSPGFELEGWISDRHADDSDMERHDPLARISPSVRRPNPLFIGTVGLHGDEREHSYFLSSGAVWNFSKWSDEDLTRRGSPGDPYTEGNVAVADRQVLIEYLRARHRDLIINVRRTQHAHHDYRSNDGAESDRYDADFAFILRRSGRLEAVS